MALEAMQRYLFLFGELFFFNDTATTEIYTLSLHDALPNSPSAKNCGIAIPNFTARIVTRRRACPSAARRGTGRPRRAASLQALLDLVVETGRQRSLLGDSQVGAQMIDARGADDGAGQVRMAEREAQHELQPRHAVEQVVQAGGRPAPLAFALG